MSDLKVVRLHAYTGDSGERGHFYDVTLGDVTERFMEWDDVAAGDCVDSHVLSNQSDLSQALGSDSHEVLAAIRESVKHD